MVVLFDDLPVQVAPVDAVLAQPVLQAAEHLEAARAHALPGVVDARLHAVVGRAQVQAQVDVRLKQLLAVLLAAATAGRVDGAGNPLAPGADGRRVDGWLGLAAVVLAVEVRDVAVAVLGAPHDGGAVPAHVHPVGARPVDRQLEVVHHDVGLVHRVDGARTQGRHAHRPRLALVRHQLRQQRGLGGFVKVRHVIPAALRDGRRSRPARMGPALDALHQLRQAVQRRESQRRHAVDGQQADLAFLVHVLRAFLVGPEDVELEALEDDAALLVGAQPDFRLAAALVGDGRALDGALDVRAGHDAGDLVARDQAGADVLGLVGRAAQHLQLKNVPGGFVRVAAHQRADGPGESLAFPPVRVVAGQVVGQFGAEALGLADPVAGHEDALVVRRAVAEESQVPRVLVPRQAPGVGKHALQLAGARASRHLLQELVGAGLLLRRQRGQVKHRAPRARAAGRSWRQCPSSPVRPAGRRRQHRSP